MAKAKIDLPNLDFEGVLVKPTKSGIYYCPFGCGVPGYPKKKWKTEKGFRQHMEVCSGRPSLIEAASKRRSEMLAKLEPRKEQILLALKERGIVVGATINYVSATIVKPMYEYRGDRRVKVRYEDVYRFEARTTEIRSIDIHEHDPDKISLDFAMQNYVKINREIRIDLVSATIDEARANAEIFQKRHDEHLRFSAECR